MNDAYLQWINMNIYIFLSKSTQQYFLSHAMRSRHLKKIQIKQINNQVKTIQKENFHFNSIMATVLVCFHLALCLPMAAAFFVSPSFHPYSTE